MRILLIEDDRALCTALLPALQAAGYTVDTCHDSADGKALLCGGAYDVCVLDRMLPGLDGLSLLRAARAKGCTTPVLMLTALSGINDRVDGLDAGADDYLGKPFDTRELLARLRALTRRPGTTAESAIRCGDVTLDAAQLTLSGPKAAAALTKREADLLEVLLRTPGQLQTRAVLLARVWGPLAEVDSGCLLFLWDNGAALHFAGTTGSADARNAVEPLLEEGLSPLLDTSLHDSSGAVQRQSAVFTLNEYRCHAALLPRGTAGSYLLVAALQDMGFVHRHAVQTVVQYGAIWFTGTLLLAIISWRLTGKALAPTALAMRRQKEFIATAGHELRSPLAVVKASLDAACRTPVTERATLLRNAEQETDRMARLVEDLLVLANGDLDALPAHLHPIAPDNLCLEVYDAFFPLAQQRQHPLSLTLPEDSVPSIEADPDRVKQLLAILLNNAFDHTPAGTPVELCLTYCGEKITLAVQDHGPGIPDAEKARVFDRFYSADPSRTDKHNFGLGLSVAKELARLHHADLTVTDTPGGGAKFAVTFAARIS